MEIPRYIMPPHIILTDLDMPAIDVVATAICWLLGKKPIEMAEYIPEMTKEITKSLRNMEASIVSDHIIVFIGMAGLMTFAKELKLVKSYNDNKYLRKKWQAVCATAKIPNMIEQEMSQNTYMIIIEYLVKWQVWITPGTSLYKKFLDYALENNEENILIKSALTQVRIVLENYNLKSVLFMETFINTYNLTLLLPAVLKQAKALKMALNELRKRYEGQFPFLKLYQFEGAEKMNYRLYPDLYYAVICICMKTEILSPKAECIMTNLQTTVPKDEITRQVKHSLTIELLDDKTRRNLRDVDIFWPRIPQGYKRKKEEEDIALMLQEFFYKSID